MSGTGGSLLSRLLRGMVLPMAGLALLLGGGGALVIRRAVETTNDRILGAASRAIAESLTVEDGAVALDLSPSIFGMLEDAERDNVYYSVRQGNRVLTGYADLPVLRPDGMQDTEVAFGNATYHGLPVRIVSEGRRLSGIGRPVTVEVAETLGARKRIETRLLIGLAVLEAALIGLSLILLPVAIRWGMQPLIRLSADMDRRLAVDLTPLPIAGVPTELHDFVGAFNGMLSRLDAALSRMRQFTADASHQLRTPLSILRAHIGVLRGSGLDAAAARESLDDIDRASERLQRLVVQLLTMARADAVELSADALEPIDLAALVADVAADHVPAAIARGIELRFVRPDGAATTATHPLIAAEMLSNIVDNAIRYGRAGGTVTVAVTAAPGGYDVGIEDDGPGIAPEDRARVVTRFARLERDVGQTGSGLGLAIADALARSVGAKLRLETARGGQGLLVRILFPG